MTSAFRHLKVWLTLKNSNLNLRLLNCYRRQMLARAGYASCRPFTINRLVVLYIMFPFGNHFLKIRREFGIKTEKLLCDGVNEPQGFSVKRLTGNDLKTIFDELFVLRENRSLQNLITPVEGIIEDRVTAVLHVCTNLGSAPGSKP